jgi:hypothetical protein
MTAPEMDPAPGELEGVRGAPRRRAHPGFRSVPRLRRDRSRRGDALDHLRVYDFKTGTWTSIAFPEPVYAVFPGRHAGIRIHHLSLQLPEHGDAAQRFRLRRARTGKSTLAQAAGSAGRLRSRSSTRASACGPPRATECKVPISIVYKKGFPRDGKAPLLPLRLRLLRLRHAALVFQQPA